MKTNEIIVDVRTLIPRERHPRIFNTWESLNPGTAMLLVNDHDPVPLYYQFAAEHRGAFHWEYLEQGPETWRVRINKGDYADPGFVPGKGSASVKAKRPTPVKAPLVLDVRPILARGGSPCSTIDEAVTNLAPGQSLVLFAPFEPAPLFGKLGAQGFDYRSEAMADGSWRIEFIPKKNSNPVVTDTPASCSCH